MYTLQGNIRVFQLCNSMKSLQWGRGQTKKETKDKTKTGSSCHLFQWSWYMQFHVLTGSHHEWCPESHPLPLHWTSRWRTRRVVQCTGKRAQLPCFHQRLLPQCHWLPGEQAGSQVSLGRGRQPTHSNWKQRRFHSIPLLRHHDHNPIFLSSDGKALYRQIDIGTHIRYWCLVISAIASHACTHTQVWSTTDTNGRAGSTGADEGGAHRGRCSQALILATA